MYNELEHFGILGMKWGVRRFQNPDGTLTEAGKAREAKQRRKEAHDTVRNLSTMSDEDMDALKTRLTKEKELRKLIQEDIDAGKPKASKLIEDKSNEVLANAIIGGLAASGMMMTAKLVGVKLPKDEAKKYTKDYMKKLPDYLFPNPNGGKKKDK